MDPANSRKSEDGRHLPAGEPPISIEPLKVKRPSRTVREVEALVMGLQVALVTELSATKEEILQAIREGQAVVEAMAREMERKLNRPVRSADDND